MKMRLLEFNALGIQYHLHKVECVKSWAWKCKTCININFRSLDETLYHVQWQDKLAY